MIIQDRPGSTQTHGYGETTDAEPDYQALDPGALIEKVIADMGYKGEGRIKVVAEIDHSVQRIMLDAHAFHQCLANLIRNAAEAIPEDREGTVKIRLETEGDRAIFTVTDDGIGMNAETIERIKGGMYSTKRSKGTGLGLLVIQKIVSEHKGTLAIVSEE